MIEKKKCLIIYVTLLAKTASLFFCTGKRKSIQMTGNLKNWIGQTTINDQYFITSLSYSQYRWAFAFRNVGIYFFPKQTPYLKRLHVTTFRMLNLRSLNFISLSQQGNKTKIQYLPYVFGSQIWANSVDPDDMLQNAASHQGLHCLPVIQQLVCHSPSNF